MGNITMSIKMIKDAGQPVCHVHQALLLTGRQHTRLWNHNFGQFWVSSHLGILDNLDVADILDNFRRVWGVYWLRHHNYGSVWCCGHSGQFGCCRHCGQILYSFQLDDIVDTLDNLGHLDILGIVDYQWMSWSLWTITGCHGHCGQSVDVMVIVDNHWMSWALQTISGCHGHCGQFPNEAFCSHVLAWWIKAGVLVPPSQRLPCFARLCFYSYSLMCICVVVGWPFSLWGK